ncbi:septum site-determining protein MinC [Accumulibacter sp.]|uniref:septum site-determining protein MinC n=1 Tax=Accumulibacter sp. TaxID=2053492 RepID=UPI002634716D|nr:septum site-determining protein MinC [Accumulibacter sp.]
MPRAHSTLQLIEFKGVTLPVVAVTVHSLQVDELAAAAAALFGDDPFFDGDAALLELSQVGELPRADWPRLHQVLKAYGLNVIGVRGGSEALRQSAAAAGLPAYASIQRPPRAAPAAETPLPEPAAKTETAPVTAAAAGQPTLFVDRPLRSGQQVYARGGDLVVLAAVNAGAEVIADGSIHIYAPLRGRALAGAGGAEDARILCTRFDAELVSIAGLYRTFEAGVPPDMAGKPVQVRLTGKADDDRGRLVVLPLRTD